METFPKNSLSKFLVFYSFFSPGCLWATYIPLGVHVRAIRCPCSSHQAVAVFIHSQDVSGLIPSCIMTSVLIFFNLILIRISLFYNMYGHLTFSILLKHLNRNVCCFWVSPSFTFNVSHPYNNTAYKTHL